MPDGNDRKMPAEKKNARITIVIPARNEEANIPNMRKEVVALAEKLPYDFEFLVIDNCSSDNTGQLVKDICREDPRWKYIRFSRNFTVEMSITAGYHFALGDAIIVLYSDLQDPPEVIPSFLEKWEEGYDIVYGVRVARPGDPAWRNLAVKMAYRVIRMFADFPIPTDAGDFRLISRRVRDALEDVTETNRYMRGLIPWLGFKQIGVVYERRPRKAGKSNAPFWSIFFFAFNAITGFSLKPLRFFTFLGFITIFLSIFASIIYALLYLKGSVPPGITTLIILGLISIGLNSLGIGILGEYVGRTYLETKHRPLFIVDERVGFD